MIRINRLLLLALCLAMVSCGAPPPDNAPIESETSSPQDSAALIYRGMCDASAAVDAGRGLFVVANDEDNVLRFYNRDEGGFPRHEIDLTPLMNLEGDKIEMDMEGAARIGERIYWITSHGRNKEGKERPNRRRFFATEMSWDSERPRVSLVGSAYENLLNDLIQAPQYRSFGLGAAALKAPKDSGAFNIEGLAEGRVEGELLIGFRNPILQTQALIAPLKNAGAVLLNGARAQFGEPILLQLEARGIRSMIKRGTSYVIVAGSFDSLGSSKLFHWNPADGAIEALNALRIESLNPEALITYDDRPDQFQLLSDDGGREIGGVECKDLPADQRFFRSVWMAYRAPRVIPGQRVAP